MKLGVLASTLKMPGLPAQLKQVNDLMIGLFPGSGRLDELSREVINSGGKRLRPALLLAIARGGPAANGNARRLAAAIELTHLASLVHDDLIDGAATRRGQPSISRVWGMETAILLGDYLLAKAIAMEQSVSGQPPELASVIAEMAEGQARQFDPSETMPVDSNYTETARQKTGSLFSAACRYGGHCGGLRGPNLRSLSKYGACFGIAYQIIDDVLDKDIRPGALEQAKQYFAQAIDNLDLIDYNQTVIDGLRQLPDIYLDWAVGSQSAIV